MDNERIGNVNLDLTHYSGQDLYCDGEVEDRLLELAKTHPEAEFEQIIRSELDWPTLYHFSSIRGNIVSWIPFGGTEKVLEIGAGPGAVTGALTARCGRVDCVELSHKRSLINAWRRKDDDGLTIHVGNFEEIEPQLDRDYNYIFLIGVLEYAGSYLHSPDPFRDELRRVLSHLAPGGRAVIAIENRLGLKYWAGCAEDHSGRYFDGIESYAKDDAPARTFTRPALERMLREAGAYAWSFYYPYPDYKFTEVLYSDRRLPLASELSDNIRNFDRDRLLLFDEQKAYRGIAEDGLYPLFANSYEIVIGPPLPVVYCKFSNDRAPQYRIRTEIVLPQGAGAEVRKYPMTPEAAPHVARLEESGRRLRERYEEQPAADPDASQEAAPARAEEAAGRTGAAKGPVPAAPAAPDEAAGPDARAAAPENAGEDGKSAASAEPESAQAGVQTAAPEAAGEPDETQAAAKEETVGAAEPAKMAGTQAEETAAAPLEGAAVNTARAAGAGEPQRPGMAEPLLHIAPCSRTEGGGVVFPFVGGQSLESLLDQCLSRGEGERFLQLLEEFRRRVGSGGNQAIADYDMTFDNILIEGDTWTAIDYEWAVEERIPAQELLFRSLLVYYLEDENRSSRCEELIGQEVLLERIGMPEEQANRLAAQEQQFQNQVTGGVTPLGELRARLGTEVIKPAQLQTAEEIRAAEREQVEEERNLVSVQVYYDFGAGFTEEDAFWIDERYRDEGIIRFRIAVPEEVQNLRVDPAICPCIILLREVWIDDADCTEKVNKLARTNGRQYSNGSIVYTNSDPWMEWKCRALRRAAGQPQGGEFEIEFAIQLAGIPSTMAQELENRGRGGPF